MMQIGFCPASLNFISYSLLIFSLPIRVFDYVGSKWSKGERGDNPPKLFRYSNH